MLDVILRRRKLTNLSLLKRLIVIKEKILNSKDEYFFQAKEEKNLYNH
jgi:hypothetical protein